VKIPPFRLQAPLRYRSHQRDLVRGFLAEALAELNRCRLEVESLERDKELALEDLVQATRPGSLNVDHAVTQRIHIGQLKSMILDAERRVHLAEDQVDLCRRALVLADQKVKSLENLEEQDRIAFIQKQEQKESREREDNWLSINAFQR